MTLLQRIAHVILIAMLFGAAHSAAWGQINLTGDPPAPIRILPGNAPTFEIPKPALRDLEDFWRGIIQEDRLPGAAIGVIQDHGLVHEFCIGQRRIDETSPIDANTIFNAGGATLAFTTLMGATADRPDAPVFDRRAATVSSLFRMTDPRARERCRVRDLLTMSAGIPPYSDDILDPQWARPEDVFALIGQAPVMSPPGAYYRPSDVSAAVGGYLTAMIAGNRHRGIFANYADTMDAQLVKPLGMTRTTFMPAEGDNVASGHRADENGFNVAYFEEPREHPLAPVISMRTTLNDATRWIRAELEQGVAPDGKRLAPMVSVRERWQPAHVGGQAPVGMGWRRVVHEETEILLANGVHAGQTAAVGLFPAYRTGFAVFVNAEGEAPERLTEAVALGLAEALKASRHVSVAAPLAQEGANRANGGAR